MQAMRKREGARGPGQRFALMAWLGACCLVLAGSALSYFRYPGGDDDILFAYLMLALSFPAGLAVFGALGGLAVALHELFGAAMPAALQLAMLWLGCVAAGYVQWFIFLPWVIRRLRTRE